ncbi:hypothetical protein GCM10023185_33340 [Hymenobacter saemangeumensis]|uniref:Uncharacterized protein n=1 Tax=Hymenobacter saemangeumensis TaxID=1084522 RepID=A0ABP8INW3_9BACT
MANPELPGQRSARRYGGCHGNRCYDHGLSVAGIIPEVKSSESKGRVLKRKRKKTGQF